MTLFYPKEQFDTLTYLYNAGRDVSSPELCEKLNIDQVYIAATIKVLSDQNLINARKELYNEYSLGKRGAEFSEKGFPEIAIIKNIPPDRVKISVKELDEKIGYDKKSIGESFKFLERKRLGRVVKGEIEINEKAREFITKRFNDELLILFLKDNKTAKENEIKNAGIDIESALDLLSGRSNVINVKERSIVYASLTDEGLKLIQSGIRLKVEVTTLTADLLKDQKYREIQLKPYNVKDESRRVVPGKIHPFVRTLNKTRDIFFEMGFTEIKSPHVESSFWDFDALFQPQDHPARDMQDTFYLKRPSSIDLPDDALVQRVRDAHESGGNVGGTGWRYRWSAENAKKAILRTHTTAASARFLFSNPNPPLKVFTIGPVYRRENVTFKHLPVFYQVDGIIADEGANLAALFGTLTEFLKKMGFRRFEFRPSFFPYTEPSTEVYTYNEEKKMWFEIAGAGIFREEVTKPLGCNVPVLAWGFGFERLVMLRYGIKDIRDIYYSNINWLKEVPLCL